MKGVFWQALEFGEPDLGHSPKPFYAIDMHPPTRKFILGMIHVEVARAISGKGCKAKFNSVE